MGKQEQLEKSEVPSVPTSASTGDDQAAIDIEFGHGLTEDTVAKDSEASTPRDSDWTHWVVFSSYQAEAPGYLSVPRGHQVLAYQVDLPSAGEAPCAWPKYIFARSCSDPSLEGWLPIDILAHRYLD